MYNKLQKAKILLILFFINICNLILFKMYFKQIPRLWNATLWEVACIFHSIHPVGQKPFGISTNCY